MKVLMIAFAYPSIYDPSLGVFFKEHARAVRIFNDVAVICCYSSPVKSQLGFNIVKKFRYIEKNEEGIRTIRLEYPRISNKVDATISFFFSLFAVFRIRRRFKFDLIHAQNFFPSGLIGYFFSKLYGIRFVITEHSSSFNHTMRHFIRRKLITLAAHKASQIIAVSMYLSNSINKYYPKLSINIIANPVDTEKFSYIPMEDSNRTKKHILHISSLNQNKGVDYLIFAAKELKHKRDDFIINIIGGEHLYLMKKCQDLVSSLNLNSTIKILGRKSHDDIPDYLKTCDFFVLPSLRESFGVVLIEAMACGKPLVITDSGGPTEIVDEKIGIIVPAGNVGELVGAINFMLNNFQKFDPEYIARYARNKYGYREIGAAITKVYESALKISINASFR